MSVNIQVTVEGAEELVAGLIEDFPDELAQDVQNALSTVGECMAQDARTFCPVRTGFLQSTIALGQPTATKWTYCLIASAPYAVYVEYGTRRMAARLFMTRAVELHTQEMLTEIENAVNQAIANALQTWA